MHAQILEKEEKKKRQILVDPAMACLCYNMLVQCGG